MSKRTKVANRMGSLALALSLVFWLLLFILSAKRSFDREFFMQCLDALWYLWLPIWLVAALLTVASGILGSRRWFFALLAPAFSFWLSTSLLAGIPF